MRAMQVNHALLLKYPVDFLGIDRMLAPVVAGRELEYTVFRNPPDADIPLQPSVSFTAYHGVHEALVAEVEAAIEQAGLADRFEPA